MKASITAAYWLSGIAFIFSIIFFSYYLFTLSILLQDSDLITSKGVGIAIGKSVGAGASLFVSYICLFVADHLDRKYG